jgi:hypothetical protein
MKGVDAALWAVCDALGLEIQALPVYSPDLDDEYESRQNRSAGDPRDLFSPRVNSRAHLNRCRDDIEWIGCGFSSMELDNLGDYQDYLGSRMNEAAYFASKYTGIYWLNRPAHSEPSLAYITVQTLLKSNLPLVRE